jgi:F-type H+-transporting ATPase subunit epsilon
MKLSIKIAIPGKIIWEGEANEINVQTTSGKIGILPNHTPLIAALETSVLTIKKETTTLMVISDGYISVEKNNIFIAIDRCILEEKINKETLEKTYKTALEKLNNAKTPGKKQIATKALKRVNSCYEILEYRKNNS